MASPNETNLISSSSSTMSSCISNASNPAMTSSMTAAIAPSPYGNGAENKRVTRSLSKRVRVNNDGATAGPSAKSSNGKATDIEMRRMRPIRKVEKIELTHLDEFIVDQFIWYTEQTNDYSRLLEAIIDVFSNVEKLSRSFRPLLYKEVKSPANSKNSSKNLQDVMRKSPCDMKKEDLRTLEGENDKDEDSTCIQSSALDTISTPMAAEIAANPTNFFNINSSTSHTHDQDDAGRMQSIALDSDVEMSIDLTQNCDDDDDDVHEIEDPDALQFVSATTVDPAIIELSDDSDSSDIEIDETHTSSESTADANRLRLKNMKNVLWIDLPSLRRVKRKLAAVNGTTVKEALNTSITALIDIIRENNKGFLKEAILHCIVICFDMATNVSDNFNDFEFLEDCLPKLCHVASSLPLLSQARLAKFWARQCQDRLQIMVRCLQQLITMQAAILDELVQSNADVIAITKVMKIAYYANILAGESDPLKHVPVTTEEPTLLPGIVKTETNASACVPAQLAVAAAAPAPSVVASLSSQQCSSGNTDCSSARFANVLPELTLEESGEDDDEICYVSTTQQPRTTHINDFLATQLNINVLEVYIPIVPFEEFYNEALSNCVKMEMDYMSFRNLSRDLRMNSTDFSFMLYSFILTPAAKTNGLYYDNRIRMFSERDRTLMSFLNDPDEASSEVRPDLRLKVRRDRVVRDALIGLEMIAINSPKTLKKQLAVEFVGEEGIDEGGVSKEFFQLIVEEIFNADYGMFLEQKETHLMWFNSASFENDEQYTLIGIIIGLAIYNSIVLPLRFPMVVYRKLMGGRGSFHDLKDWSPTLYQSMRSLLEYKGEDLDTNFMLTFRVNYQNVFGEVMSYDLKPDGDNVVVTQENKQEFVKLYVDYFLNESIERQFKAFKKGFDMVTDESPLKLLFRPDEVEVLVCGSKIFDFYELERSTQYDGGYTKDTPIIIDFWKIVHGMSEESKRKLVEFTTGSDRVPVGGLSRLRLIITRNGPDTDRLPTAHTCFNTLLLPEYCNKGKLEERLFKAINYSKGFGML